MLICKGRSQNVQLKKKSTKNEMQALRHYNSIENKTRLTVNMNPLNLPKLQKIIKVTEHPGDSHKAHV